MDEKNPVDETIRLLGPEGLALHYAWLEQELTSNGTEVSADMAAVFRWSKDFLAGKATTKDGKFANSERVAMFSKKISAGNPR
jgi:hypothetical protein